MKFDLRVNYVVSGHLRYGHRNVSIEANSEEEALEKVKQLRGDSLVFEYDASEMYIDDYEINDYYRISVDVIHDRQK